MSDEKSKSRDIFYKAVLPFLGVITGAGIAYLGVMQQIDVQHKSFEQTHEVEQSKLIASLLSVFEKCDSKSASRNRMAMVALNSGVEPKLFDQVKEGAEQLAASCENASPKITQKGNGESCKSKKECFSGYCYPGPDDSGNYCLAASLNCAAPGENGRRYGQSIAYGGKSYVCYNPGNGPANWK